MNNVDDEKGEIGRVDPDPDGERRLSETMPSVGAGELGGFRRTVSGWAAVDLFCGIGGLSHQFGLARTPADAS